MTRTESKGASRSADEEGFNAMSWHAPACDDAERVSRSACSYIDCMRAGLLADRREELVELCAEDGEIVGSSCRLGFFRWRAAVFAVGALTSGLVGWT